MTRDDKSTGGTRQYDQPEASQAERRTMLRQDQAARTYFEMANGDLEAEGRTPVTGSAPPPFVAPQWSRDLAVLPPERPLGTDINAVEDTEACWWDPGAVGPKGARDDEA